MNSTDI